MKILHIYRTYFPDPPGGLQEAMRQIALATMAFGTESRILTLSPNPIPSEIELPEAKIVRLRSLAAPASCDMGGFDALAKFRELSNWADILHYHFPWPFADILRLFSQKNKPSVMTYHSDIVRQRYLGRLYEPLMRNTLQSMSKVVATSPAYAKTSRVLQHFVTNQQLQVIPLGIADYQYEIVGDDDFYLKRLLADTTQSFVLALGVLRYYKGLHVLLEAAASINAKIIIAGSGAEEEHLKASMISKKITNVIFAGQVSHQQKVILLKHCRVLALPSHLRSEAFGMVLLEASMFAKPMVSCELGTGTSFINIHGETGWVVPPESPEQLAGALNSLLEDAALANRMGIAARQRYEKLFSSEVLGKAYTELYNSVVAG
ncbi:MAG: glycosyltransferase [Methylovulum sp.]|nr:glycosyltransferase [Methylovulum sp.]